MPQQLQIVFSDPGDGVSDEEFDRWYEAHLQEILAIPGFRAAQRYQLQPQVVDGATQVPSRRVVVYEVDRDAEALTAEMERMNLRDAGSYEELKQTDADGPALPEWWSQVRFASWHCVPVGERVEAGPDHG